MIYNAHDLDNSSIKTNRTKVFLDKKGVKKTKQPKQPKN